MAYEAYLTTRCGCTRMIAVEFQQRVISVAMSHPVPRKGMGGKKPLLMEYRTFELVGRTNYHQLQYQEVTVANYKRELEAQTKLMESLKRDNEMLIGRANDAVNALALSRVEIATLRAAASATFTSKVKRVLGRG